MAQRRQGGIALLEAMLAVVILGIGLLGTVGLQARAYASLSDAGMRAEATLAAEKLIGVINADLPNILLYNVAAGATPNDQLQPWVEETKRNIPGAIVAVALVDQPTLNRYQVDVTINWRRKANSEANRHHVTAYIAR
jgi:type IV pilus assembly protein PilV